MKKWMPFVLCILLAGTSLAQNEKELPECVIEFPVKRIKVEQPQVNQIDSAWDALKRGERVRLRVLDNEENKMDDERRMILSQKRCSTMVEYLVRKQIAVVSYAVSIEPFGKKKKNAVSEMTNGAYRNMTNRSGIYSIILYKEGHEPIPFAGTDSLVLRAKNCQEFTRNPNSSFEISGNEGTIVKFQANSLVNLDGSPVTCNQVQLCLREYYSKSDMIAAGLTTHSYNRMLVSGGMIYIQATCEGKKLRLLSNKPITIYFPTNGEKKEKGMRTFYGKPTDGMTNWLPSIHDENEINNAPKPKPDPVVIEGEEIEGDYVEMEEDYSRLDYYILKSTRLGMINCDRFYEVQDKTDLYVQSDTAVKPAVSIVFSDIKSVMPGYYYSADKTIKFNDIPKGKMVTVVAFSQKGDKYFYGTQEVKIGSERLVSVPVTQMSKADFERQVKMLD